MARTKKRPRASSPVPAAFPSSSTSQPTRNLDPEHTAAPAPTSPSAPPTKKPRRKRTKHAHLSTSAPAAGGELLFSEEARRRLEDEGAKDEEERRLEEMLFGRRRKPRGKPDGMELAGGDDEARESGLGHLEDADLFFVDDAAEALDLPPVDIEASMEDAFLELPGSGDEAFEEFGGFSASNSDHTDADTAEDSLAVAPPTVAAHPLSSSAKKKPAWTDPSDATLNISLSTSNRLRKLRTSADEDTVSGREYELRLRRQFESLVPAPEWAKSSKRSVRLAGDGADGAGDVEEGLEDLLHDTGSLVQSSSSRALPPSELLVTRLADANLASPSPGGISSTSFHPTLPVLLTAGTKDRRLKLFSIDGAHNPLLASLHLPSLPITKAVFNPQGTSVFLAGPRPYYYTYDLQTGAVAQSPRGLWGSKGAQNPEEGERSLEISSFSPDGATLAVGGRRGNVYLLDCRAGGASGQVTGSVKLNAGVKALAWAPGGKELVALGEDAEVYLFDVGARRCVRRWRDEGAFGASALELSADGQRLALGASTGVVSLYDASALLYGKLEQGNPRVVKSVMNLTTRITALRFNHTTEILCLASKERKDQMRMMHVPSNTVFFNWPTSGTPLGHVTAVDFSAGSEYAAIANSKGKVLLYQLRHYAH
ncbi:WD40 repeat-like protein [Calocera cornea HHB12733]|uniref:WD40 repeat-like protein n=1 Tax=Calocera cornea HHB12733 TaxID=1353952 RepID=A0A165JFT3_9BASI|nr:WD40 repeat-like protein [Calocera cornea HHB12733]